MDKDLRPKIDLKEQPTVKCEFCGSSYFKEVTMLKKVSKILTGSSEDTYVPFSVYMCNSCNYVNSDFKVFGDDN
jgi:hypothetical protein